MRFMLFFLEFVVANQYRHDSINIMYKHSINFEFPTYDDGKNEKENVE